MLPRISAGIWFECLLKLDETPVDDEIPKTVDGRTM